MTKRRKPARNRTAVALFRVSKDATEQALGVAAQRAAVAAWAAREGVEVVAEHLEEVSGGAPLERRPVLAAAVADVEARRAMFLVALKVDRFSRDRVETGAVELQLRRAGAELVFADGVANGSTPVEEFMRTILLGAAQLERAQIRGRIKAALAVKQSRGEMTGAPRYGMQLGADGVHVEPCPTEQATLARALELSAGGDSVRAVVATLTDEGRLSRAGKPFTVAAMHRMLTKGGSK